MSIDVTTDTGVTVTDEAKATVLAVRADEPTPDLLALWLEVTGVVDGQYVYDMYFQPIADVTDAHSKFESDDLTIVVPNTSLPKLQGATLRMSGDADGSMEISNPNKPLIPTFDSISLEGVDTDSDDAAIVRAVIEQQVNPAIASHGGAAELVGLKDGAALVRLSGGCQGCSMSRATLSQGIERMIVEAVPSITSVVDVTDHATGENPYYS